MQWSPVSLLPVRLGWTATQTENGEKLEVQSKGHKFQNINLIMINQFAA
jgi:hypothetical protein